LSCVNREHDFSIFSLKIGQKYLKLPGQVILNPAMGGISGSHPIWPNAPCPEGALELWKWFFDEG